MLRSVSALLKTVLGRMYVYITMSASATRWIMSPLLLNMQLQPNFGNYLAITFGILALDWQLITRKGSSSILPFSRATKVWNKGHLWANVLHKVVAKPACYPLSGSDPGKFSLIWARLRTGRWPPQSGVQRWMAGTKKPSGASYVDFINNFTHTRDNSWHDFKCIHPMNSPMHCSVTLPVNHNPFLLSVTDWKLLHVKCKHWKPGWMFSHEDLIEVMKPVQKPFGIFFNHQLRYRVLLSCHARNNIIYSHTFASRK